MSLSQTLKAKLHEVKTNPEIRGEFIRYVVVGLSCAAVEFGLFAIGDKVIHFPIPLTNFIAQGTSVVMNFLLTQFYTFKAGSDPKGIVRNIVAYAILFVFNNILTTVCITLLVRAGMPSLLAKLIMMTAVVLWNFVLYRRVIFKKQ